MPKLKTVEIWTWVLIHGGLLLAALGAGLVVLRPNVR